MGEKPTFVLITKAVGLGGEFSVGFEERLQESLRSKPNWTPRPEVLMLPQIPKPMHGLAPRVIMGSKWWNETRQASYASTNYHCIACKVHKLQARGPKWLEGHEVYETYYIAGRMVYVETVPLCNFCHNYIHQGRLEALLDKGQITQARYATVIQHGERVLSMSGLCRPPVHNGKEAAWSKWRLVLDKKLYKPKFKSFEEWEKHYAS